MNLKAIDTLYKGCYFRSRLEARWAVFFDTLGVPYRYEPEGFDLDGLWYLPDFWLPEQQCWIEIKPFEPDAEAQEKAERLAAAGLNPVFIFFGDIPWPDGSSGDDKSYSAYAFRPDTGWDLCYQWCECWVCDTVGVQFEGRADRLPCRCRKKIDPCADRGHNADSPRLMAAYHAARSARFER